MCIFYLINLLKFTSLRMQVNVYFNSRRGNTSTFAKTFSLHCLTSAQLISQIMSVVGKAAPYTFPPLNTLYFLMWCIQDDLSNTAGADLIQLKNINCVPCSYLIKAKCHFRAASTIEKHTLQHSQIVYPVKLRKC